MAVGSMHRNRLERRLANQNRGIVASTYSTTAGTGTSGVGTPSPTPSPAPAAPAPTTYIPQFDPQGTGGQNTQNTGLQQKPPSHAEMGWAVPGYDAGNDRQLQKKKDPVRKTDAGMPWWQNER